MKQNERQQKQKQAEAVVRKIFGEHLLDVSFHYYRGGRSIFINYEDLKPEQEMRSELKRAVIGKWNFVLLRKYSTKNVMNTMLDLYNKNRVAVVDIKNGELRPFTIQAYVNGLMAVK